MNGGSLHLLVGIKLSNNTVVGDLIAVGGDGIGQGCALGGGHFKIAGHGHFDVLVLLEAHTGICSDGVVVLIGNHAVSFLLLQGNGCGNGNGIGGIYVEGDNGLTLFGSSGVLVDLRCKSGDGHGGQHGDGEDQCK